MNLFSLDGKSAAIEFASLDIRVNAVSPGPFISPHMTQSIFDAISVFISTACVVSVLDRG